MTIFALMNEDFLIDVLKELQSASFPQEVFIKRKTLSKENVCFMLNSFWNNKSLKQLVDLIRQKQQELYQYSLDMGYIDNSVSFEQFIK